MPAASPTRSGRTRSTTRTDRRRADATRRTLRIVAELRAVAGSDWVFVDEAGDPSWRPRRPGIRPRRLRVDVKHHRTIDAGDAGLLTRHSPYQHRAPFGAASRRRRAAARPLPPHASSRLGRNLSGGHHRQGTALVRPRRADVDHPRQGRQETQASNHDGGVRLRVRVPPGQGRRRRGRTPAATPSPDRRLRRCGLQRREAGPATRHCFHESGTANGAPSKTLVSPTGQKSPPSTTRPP